MTPYVLDTSALLTYIENEEGAAEVESLLQKTIDDEVALYVSIVTSIEVFYISSQEQGRDVAIERLELIDDLPVTQEQLDSRLTKNIGEIKVTKAMSIRRLLHCGTGKVPRGNSCTQRPRIRANAGGNPPNQVAIQAKIEAQLIWINVVRQHDAPVRPLRLPFWGSWFHSVGEQYNRK